jgi:phasin family protein
MAESPSKSDAAATVSTTKVAQAVDGDQAAPVNTAKVAEAVAKPAKAAPKKVAVKKAAPKKAVAKKAAPAKKPVAPPTSKAAPAKAAAAPTTPIPQLKETIMATAKNDTTTEYTAKAQELAADMQARVKSAYDKGTEMTKEAVAFQKGNLEALVESGKILASGIQDMGRTCVEEAKSVAETTQDDVKKFAAIKSPTEMFQLQGEIARRNFDAMVSTTSKNTETMLKLVNEAFAPMSNRMSLAAEKVGKAA